MALELSNYLNDSSYALQAVTQCYGLLAPIIYHNIVLVPVVQVRVSPPPHRVFFNKGKSTLHFGKENATCVLESTNRSRMSIMTFRELTERYFNNLNYMSGKT